MPITDKFFSTSYSKNIEQHLYKLQQQKTFTTAEREIYIKINQRLKGLHSLQELDVFLKTLIQNDIFPNIFIFNQRLKI